MWKAILLLGCSVVVLSQSTAATEHRHPVTTAGTTDQQIIDHGGKIESKYDGFNYETVIRLRKMPVTCTGFKGTFKDGCVSIDVALHLPAKQLNYVRSVTLLVIFEARDWVREHPLDQRDLSVVTETETLRFGRMKLVRQGNTTWETKVEALAATLPYDAFKKIALSRSVEVQVGQSRVELKEKNLLALRDLNSRVLTD